MFVTMYPVCVKPIRKLFKPKTWFARTRAVCDRCFCECSMKEISYSDNQWQCPTCKQTTNKSDTNLETGQT